jgi:hypothetical protein
MCFMFDEAMKLRDVGDLVAARRLLGRLVEQLAPHDGTLLSAAHVQLGQLAKRLGEHRESEPHFRAAVTASPISELASLGLFHVLFEFGRLRDAFQEMVRLLRRRYSEMYDEMLLEPRFGTEFTDELQDLLVEARRLQAKHRPS